MRVTCRAAFAPASLTPGTLAPAHGHDFEIAAGKSNLLQAMLRRSPPADDCNCWAVENSLADAKTQLKNFARPGSLNA